MNIRHEHSGYFGPPPLHCPCCGVKETQRGCVRGFPCQCDWNWCRHCFKCSLHCTCESRLDITLPVFFKAVSLFAKAAVLESWYKE